MKYLTEFRDGILAKSLATEIRASITRPWAIMEVCGGQTYSIIRNGIDQLLPPEIELIHGPGCPVCVTPVVMIDRALAIAAQPGTIFCSFGDMLRVPGTREDLLTVKGRGADVRVVYSPLDALILAKKNPLRQVVFFAIGFETTAPANAMAVYQAKRLGLNNYTVLVSHVLVPPAIQAIMSSAANRVHAFLAAGHVCSVMGFHQYLPLAERYRVPIVVTGFEPLDLLEGIRRAVLQLEAGTYEVENAYARVVTLQGNSLAQTMLAEVYENCDREWRGLGVIPQSGLKLRREYRSFDAEERFPIGNITSVESSQCRSGEVLRGMLKPDQCESFGTACTPQTPLGAPMVSSEGACAAYFHHGRLLNLGTEFLSCPS